MCLKTILFKDILRGEQLLKSKKIMVMYIYENTKQEWIDGRNATN